MNGTNWFNEIVNSVSNIPNAITYYESELKEARKEVGLYGRLEKAASTLPGIVEQRFNQLQEIEAILEHLNIELRKLRSAVFRKFTEHYKKALSSRDAEKYVDGEDEVVDFNH